MAILQAEPGQQRLARTVAQGGATRAKNRPVRTATGGPRVDPEVLRDMRHEIGNHFHKLYYWADLLAAEDTGEPTGTPSLARALRSFEGFLRTALLYFHGPGEAMVAVSATEVGQALQSILAEGGTPVEVDCPKTLSTLRLSVDTERLSTAFRLIGEQLLRVAGSGNILGFRVQLRTLEGAATKDLEIAIEVPRGLAVARPSAEVDLVCWSVAGRIVEHHGGWLAALADESQSVRTTLRLPVPDPAAAPEF